MTDLSNKLKKYFKVKKYYKCYKMHVYVIIGCRSPDPVFLYENIYVFKLIENPTRTYF